MGGKLTKNDCSKMDDKLREDHPTWHYLISVAGPMHARYSTNYGSINNDSHMNVNCQYWDVICDTCKENRIDYYLAKSNMIEKVDKMIQDNFPSIPGKSSCVSGVQESKSTEAYETIKVKYKSVSVTVSSKTLVVLGSKGSGKSSLLNNLWYNKCDFVPGDSFGIKGQQFVTGDSSLDVTTNVRNMVKQNVGTFLSLYDTPGFNNDEDEMFKFLSNYGWDRLVTDVVVCTKIDRSNFEEMTLMVSCANYLIGKIKAKNWNNTIRCHFVLMNEDSSIKKKADIKEKLYSNIGTYMNQFDYYYDNVSSFLNSFMRNCHKTIECNISKLYSIRYVVVCGLVKSDYDNARDSHWVRQQSITPSKQSSIIENNVKKSDSDGLFFVSYVLTRRIVC
jgi:ribosome biogenesis GTPase A